MDRTLNFENFIQPNFEKLIIINLPASLSCSRLLFFLSAASSGCLATVADDDTTPDTPPVLEGGTLEPRCGWDDAISDRLPLPTVVVGDTVLDVTDVATETRGRVDTEAAPTTEATGVLDTIGMVTWPEATEVVDSVVMETVGGMREEATGADSEEAIAVAVIIGGMEVVEGTDVVVAEATTLVLMIGVTTCGDVVRTNTAATGA